MQGRGRGWHRDRELLSTDPATSGRESFAPLISVSAVSFAEAEHRYREAVARRDAFRDAWISLEEPLLATRSTGQLVEHPLLTMLRDHDILVDRLAVAVRQRNRGPEPSAVLKPSIGESPAAKLRAVK